MLKKIGRRGEKGSRDTLMALAQKRQAEVLNAESRCSVLLRNGADIRKLLLPFRDAVAEAIGGEQMFILMVNGAADIEHLSRGSCWGFTFDVDLNGFSSQRVFDTAFPMDDIGAGRVPEHFARNGFQHAEEHSSVLYVQKDRGNVDIIRQERMLGLAPGVLRKISMPLIDRRRGVGMGLLPPELCILQDFKSVKTEPENYRAQLRALRGAMLAMAKFGGVENYTDAMMRFMTRHSDDMGYQTSSRIYEAVRCVPGQVDAALGAALAREKLLPQWMFEQKLMFGSPHPRGKDLLREMLLRMPLPECVVIAASEDPKLSETTREAAQRHLLRTHWR